MRKLLADLLRSAPEIEVVGVACDGAEAMELAARLKPDVVTLDVEMPAMSGLEALPALSRRTTSPVVMVSALTQEGAEVTLDGARAGGRRLPPQARPAPARPAQGVARPPRREGPRRRAAAASPAAAPRRAVRRARPASGRPPRPSPGAAASPASGDGPVAACLRRDRHLDRGPPGARPGLARGCRPRSRRS